MTKRPTPTGAWQERLRVRPASRRIPRCPTTARLIATINTGFVMKGLSTRDEKGLMTSCALTLRARLPDWIPTNGSEASLIFDWRIHSEGLAPQNYSGSLRHGDEN